MANPSAIFEKIDAALSANPDATKPLDAVFQFDITGADGGTWVIDARAETTEGFVTEGPSGDAQCTITMKDTDWEGLTSGTLNPMNAFMMGKIKISGDMGLAMKLQNLLKLAS